MYSVVLLVALSGGADVTAYGPDCGGCIGCYGGGYASGGYGWGGCAGGYGCSGGYDSGCWGGGCSGGCSGSCHGGGHHLFGGHGCHGGGHGHHRSSCNCSGSCHGGGHGLFSHHGGHGCNGCNGGCNGGCYGGYGCTGGGYGCTGGYYGGGCSGWGGGYGCAGGGYGCDGGVMYGAPGGYGTPVVPGGTTVPADTMPKPKNGDKKNGTEEAGREAPANIAVILPSDATLTVDGVATTSTSANRLFTTPALPAGQEFSYTLKAEIVRDGKTLTATERVAVRAGQETRVSMLPSMFAASVAAK
jgi:uncharacterized protein (TIGR03000 family)